MISHLIGVAGVVLQFIGLLGNKKPSKSNNLLNQGTRRRSLTITYEESSAGESQ